MTKLTTERLEELANATTPSVKYVGREIIAMARQLLAYEQAAKNPVAWNHNKLSEGCGMTTPLYAAPVLPKQPELVEKLKKVMNNWLAMEPKLAYQPEFTDVMMLLDAEAAPAQPEPEIQFGDVEPIEVTDDMVYAFHNQLSDSALGSDEFTDIKHGLCAALMNIPRPAQRVIPDEITSASAPEVFEIAAEAERLGLRGTYASYAVGWNACRSEMLKAQQNEPQNIPAVAQENE